MSIYISWGEIILLGLERGKYEYWIYDDRCGGSSFCDWKYNAENLQTCSAHEQVTYVQCARQTGHVGIWDLYRAWNGKNEKLWGGRTSE